MAQLHCCCFNGLLFVLLHLPHADYCGVLQLHTAVYLCPTASTAPLLLLSYTWQLASPFCSYLFHGNLCHENAIWDLFYNIFMGHESLCGPFFNPISYRCCSLCSGKSLLMLLQRTNFPHFISFHMSHVIFSRVQSYESFLLAGRIHSQLQLQRFRVLQF